MKQIIIVAILVGIGIISIATIFNISSFTNTMMEEKQDPSSLYNTSISVALHKQRSEFFEDEAIPIGGNVTFIGTKGIENIGISSYGANFIVLDHEENIVFDYHSRDQINDIVFDQMLPNPGISAVAAHNFGFEWNQLDLNGNKVSPGKYTVYFTYPVMVHGKATYLKSQQEEISILPGKPELEIHELSLILDISKRNLLNTDRFQTTAKIGNPSNKTEKITVDSVWSYIKDTNDRVVMGGGSSLDKCYYYHTFSIQEPYVLDSYQEIDLFKETSYPPEEPGLFYFETHAMLSINEKNRVECLHLVSEKIPLNITAKIFDGISLVVITDKTEYKRNETVKIDAYIENNSKTPFALKSFSPTMEILDENKKNVFGKTITADFVSYPIVQPGEKYSLSQFDSFNWNQQIIKEDGSTISAKSGKYYIKFKFNSPYLESNEIPIVII